MTPELYRQLIEADRALRGGDRVYAYWTGSRRSFSVRAEVVRINEKSVVVETLFPIRRANYGGASRLSYPAGSRVKVPRISDAERWTSRNCWMPATEISLE